MYLSRVVRITLRKLLDERGMSAYALAKRANLSFGTIYRLARRDGRFSRIEAKTLDAICAVLDVAPGALFERVSDRRH
jgi:putative transcriptional regulator